MERRKRCDETWDWPGANQTHMIGLLALSLASGCYQGVAGDFVPDPDALSDGDAGEEGGEDPDDDADASESGEVDTDPGLSCDVRDVLEAYACSTCHDATPGVEGGGLDLISDGLAERLLNQPSLNASCSSELLIDGAEPWASVFLRVLDPERYADVGSSTCAPPVMPLGSNVRVSDDEIDCLEEWVTGLTEDGKDVPPAPFDPSSSESSVNKVKYLLHGGAVTDDELALARTEEGELDEDALRQLIDSWIWSEPGQLTPEFDLKLQMFLDLALQQRDKTVSDTFKYQVQLDLKTDDDPIVDRGTFADTVGPMFVLTARDLVADEHDFREVVTTRRWRVSTAILAALVHADTDLLNHRGRFDDVDKFGNFAHLQPEDYTDWRYVNLEQATADSPMELEAGPIDDIPIEETLATAGKTLARAVGVPDDIIEERIVGGRAF